MRTREREDSILVHAVVGGISGESSSSHLHKISCTPILHEVSNSIYVKSSSALYKFVYTSLFSKDLEKEK